MESFVSVKVHNCNGLTLRDAPSEEFVSHKLTREIKFERIAGRGFLEGFHESNQSERRILTNLNPDSSLDAFQVYFSKSKQYDDQNRSFFSFSKDKETIVSGKKLFVETPVT